MYRANQKLGSPYLTPMGVDGPMMNIGNSNGGSNHGNNNGRPDNNTQFVEVWAKNLEEEFVRIRQIIQNYPYVSMVCQLVGVVSIPEGERESVCNNVVLGSTQLITIWTKFILDST